MSPSGYIDRVIDPAVHRLLSLGPAVMLTGPRAAGKTTTALRHVVDVLRLDRPEEAAAVRADPDAALRSAAAPLLIDEWQRVPEVLWAVKRAVDVDPAPGRFVITGSVTAETDERSWPVTGRVVRVPVWPLTRREIGGRPDGRDLLTRLVVVAQERGGPAALDSLVPPRESPDVVDYVDVALRGGLPPVVAGPAREYPERWLSSYLEQVAVRDVRANAANVDPGRLSRYVSVLAENTAGVPTTVTLTAAAGINDRTAGAYDALLTGLGILDIVPAWSSNRLKRLTARGKRFLVDTGLVGAAWQVRTPRTVLRDSGLVGRLVESHVAAEVRGALAGQDVPAQTFHVRDRDGHEVDLLLDYGAIGAVGIEVKATAAPTSTDARHLRWLADNLGDRFLFGLVLHTGTRVHRFAPDIAAVPIAALWE